jgi:hypothetical protein
VANHPVFVLVCALLGALAAIVAIAVPIRASLVPEDEASSPADLAIEFGPYKAEVTSYVVPASAPFEDFPFAPSPGCTPEQQAWLAEHGQERRRDWLVEFRSTAAGTGNMLTLENLRLSGSVTEKAEPGLVFVDCPDAGIPDLVDVAVPIGEDNPGIMTTLADGTPRPFVFNLEPGEAGVALVHLLGPPGFEGDVTFDVASAESSETTTLNEVPLALPALSGISLNVSVSEGTLGLFSCSNLGDEQQQSWPCTPAQIRTHTFDECAETRLRSASDDSGNPLADIEFVDDERSFVYDSFSIHGCKDGYALVEASMSSASSFDFWVMKQLPEGWKIVSVASTNLSTPRSQALFTREALDQALDNELTEFEAAVGTTTQSGRTIAN